MDSFVRADSTNLPKLSNIMILEYMASSDKHNVAEIRGAKVIIPKASSITEPVVNTGSLQILQDVSPTKPIRRKEATPGAPLSLLGVRGLRDEPLHRSAHCIPHPTQNRPLVNPTLQELSGSVPAGGSEPDLNAAAAPTVDISTTSSEDDKPKEVKDKGSRSRAKAALVKRVRSVAVFSLGLRKAREAQEHKGAANTPHTPDKLNCLGLPAPMLGGELSLIPIEQLIQVDDVKRNAENNMRPS